ncbi:hypothetical protein BDY21DRAFT_424703 [Lineolata rhizophorae]|uniref:PD-(D/E)XK nuclease-like domain-containing protein n=1 Tax=Lineolata rhizophorae TaxID=578093 RepID=A0A6A6NN31_9PEZI|nr:hypothetical protein BDY21DRAFT_424703 [Lineolata rhizophorae]
MPGPDANEVDFASTGLPRPQAQYPATPGAVKRDFDEYLRDRLTGWLWSDAKRRQELESPASPVGSAAAEASAAPGAAAAAAAAPPPEEALLLQAAFAPQAAVSSQAGAVPPQAAAPMQGGAASPQAEPAPPQAGTTPLQGGSAPPQAGPAPPPEGAGLPLGEAALLQAGAAPPQAGTAPLQGGAAPLQAGPAPLQEAPILDDEPVASADLLSLRRRPLLPLFRPLNSTYPLLMTTGLPRPREHADEAASSLPGLSVTRSTLETPSPRTDIAAAQLRALHLDPNGVDQRPFLHATGQLLALVTRLGQLSDGACSFLSSGRKTEIKEAARTDRRMVKPPDFMFDDTGERDRAGPTPGVASVLSLAEDSVDNERSRVDEHAWNCSVHFPLLRLAVYGGHARATQLLHVVPCTTAAIAKEHARCRGSTAHMVDFCIAFRPSAVAHEDRAARAAADRIDELRFSRPFPSVNHTEYRPLTDAVVGVSVETKRDAADDPTLQMVYWQDALWRHLVNLGPAGLEVAADRFLPSLMVKGAQWYFSAMTMENHRVVFWEAIPLGSTNTALGVYRIIYSIQLITHSMMEPGGFWPWYQTSILRIGGHAGFGGERRGG